MFYRRTNTKKSDWEEVEDRDPVPVYRDKPLYRKRLPKQKKIVKLPPKKPKKKRTVIDLTKEPKKKSAPRREIIDLTDDRDDEKLAEIERDEKEVDYYFESAKERAERIEKMDRQVTKADPQTNNISKKRRHLLFLNPGDGVLQRGIMSFLNDQPLPPWAVPFAKNLRYDRNKGRLIWVEDGAAGVLLRQTRGREAAVLRPAGTEHDQADRC